MARAGTLVVALIVAHSFVDYPLRTGAMMAILAFACGLLVAPLSGSVRRFPQEAARAEQANAASHDRKKHRHARRLRRAPQMSLFRNTSSSDGAEILSGPRNGASTDGRRPLVHTWGRGRLESFKGREQPPSPLHRVHMRHRLVLSVVDLCLIGLATLFAQLLRDSFETRPEQLLALLPYLGVTLAAAIPSLAVFKLNQSIWRFSGMADYLSALGAAILIVAAAVGLGFLVNRLEGVARSLPVIQAHLIVFGLVGVRVAARLRHKGRGRAAVRPAPTAGAPENILVVGINLITELYLRSVAEFSAGRVQVMGLLAGKGDNTGRLVHRHRILGHPEQIASILGDLEVHGVPISRVVVTLPFDELSSQARAALHEAQENLHIRVEFFADHICGAERFEHAAPAVPPLRL